MKFDVPGPLPHPRAPRLKAPAGSCDCHCHVFGPLDEYPYVPEREYTAPEALFEAYEALLAHLGIDRTVIVQPSVYGSDNRCTEHAIRRFGDRARGVAVVDPDVDEAELRRLDGAGFRGVRFNLVQTGGSAPAEALEDLARRVEPLGWHVQVFTRGPRLAELAPILARLPVTLVIDHLGYMDPDAGEDQPGVRALLDLVRAGNTYVKLCPYRYDTGGYPFDKAAVIARKLADARPDRLVWGTDWPHPSIPAEQMPDDGDLLDTLGEWYDDEGLIRQILADNPARLYGF